MGAYSSSRYSRCLFVASALVVFELSSLLDGVFRFL